MANLNDLLDPYRQVVLGPYGRQSRVWLKAWSTDAGCAFGKRVKVYRNLKHGKAARPLYSVVYKGRVVARLHRVLLSTCQFVVSEAGRQRVLKTGHKNVHAFVVGKFANGVGCGGIDENGRDFGMRVSYNPKVGPNFTYDAPGAGYHNKPVQGAGMALLNEHGVTASYTF